MAKRLASAAVGAAVSLLFVLGAYYIPNLSISLNVLACLGTMLPLTKGYYREASLASIAVIVIGAILVNVQIVPYALVGSLYTICTILAYNKEVKYVYTLPFKMAYAGGSFYVFYSLFSLISVNLDRLTFLQSFNSTQLFWVFCAVWVVVFLAFDVLLINLYKYILERFKSVLERI